MNILQGQKQEVDQILKKETAEVRTLNDAQLQLASISAQDMERVAEKTGKLVKCNVRL